MGSIGKFVSATPFPNQN